MKRIRGCVLTLVQPLSFDSGHCIPFSLVCGVGLRLMFAGGLFLGRRRNPGSYKARYSLVC